MRASRGAERPLQRELGGPQWELGWSQEKLGLRGAGRAVEGENVPVVQYIIIHYVGAAKKGLKGPQTATLPSLKEGGLVIILVHRWQISRMIDR